jgi:hypothetical protein
VFYWLTWTTRTPRLWRPEQTSYGPFNPGTSTSSSTVTVVQPEGQEVDFVAAVRSGSQRGGNSHGGAHGERPEVAALPMSRRLPRRPGWLPACVLSTGGTGTRLHPARRPAAGRETVAPGATKLGRPQRTFAPVGLAVRPAVSGRHWRILQHLPSPVFTASLWSILKGPGGQTIPCWGEKQLPVQFSGRRFTWTFLLASVEFPILGADFLKHFNLIVDLAASQLLATDTLQRFAAGPPAAAAAAAQSRGGLFSAVESTPPLYRGVFNEFQDVASSSRLNLATTPDTYPLPNIQDLSARLGGCTIFSKLDLRKGYYQIPGQEGDIHKTTVITPFGLWEFLRMPFGLRNARHSFQRFMDEVLSGQDFAFCYLDDILIGSSTPDEHLLHYHRRRQLHRWHPLPALRRRLPTAVLSPLHLHPQRRLHGWPRLPAPRRRLP